VAWYLDTSALVKLVVVETETPALIAWLRETDRRVVTADLARTELLRAVRRSAPDRLVRARNVLAAVDLLGLDAPLLDQAALLDPPSLRTLDALHVAAALVLGDDLEGFVAYDERLLAAAAAAGLVTVSPA
jgi:predicted nucleic acid-binding protein